MQFIGVHYVPYLLPSAYWSSTQANDASSPYVHSTIFFFVCCPKHALKAVRFCYTGRSRWHKLTTFTDLCFVSCSISRHLLLRTLRRSPWTVHLQDWLTASQNIWIFVVLVLKLLFSKVPATTWSHIILPFQKIKLFVIKLLTVYCPSWLWSKRVQDKTQRNTIWRD